MGLKIQNINNVNDFSKKKEKIQLDKGFCSKIKKKNLLATLFTRWF